MRRPLLLLCFSEALGVLLGYYAGSRIGLMILVLAVFFAAALRFCGGHRTVLLFCAALLLFGYTQTCIRERRGVNETERVETHAGTVTGIEIRESYTALTLRTGREKILVRFGVSGDEKVYDLVGRKVSVTGKCFAPDPRRNPGCFDYRLYLKGRGIRRICAVSRYRLEAGPVARPLLHFLSVRKGRFLFLAREVMDEDAFGVMAGLLFGETGYLEDDLYVQFRENGVAHVLAVSGLHVGLLYAVVMKLLKKRRSVFSDIAVLVTVFLYAALSGFSVSVLRASVMIALNVAAFRLHRRYDLVCAASFAAMLFLTVNPYQLFDSGFQLSFTAAYGIGVALPWAELKLTELADTKKKAWICDVGKIAAPCVMVQLAMAPLLTFHFLTFSPVALLLNPFAVALAGLILPAGLAMFVLSFLTAGILFIGAAGSENALCRLLIALNDAGSMLGGSYSVPAPGIVTLVLYYTFFFFFFSETRYVLCRRRKHGTVALLWTLLAAGSMLFPWLFGVCISPLPWADNTASVTFVDVGQGDCIHVHRGSTDILIDGGGSFGSDIAERTLKPYLLKNGIDDVDLAIITHDDLDHRKGIGELDRIFRVRRIAAPGTFSAGDTILIGDGMRLDVLWPPAASDGGKENDSSLVMMLTAGDVRLLLTGDVEFVGEEALMRFCGDFGCDVLKVSHHGSKGATGEDFLSAADPCFAVISCGKNNSYGHPSARVIELLEKSDIIYARTDRDGAVSLRGTKNGVLVLENASKEKRWLIPRKQKNTRSEPFRK